MKEYFEKAHEIINADNKSAKKYKDIGFLYSKISYHISNLKEKYPETIKKHTKENQEFADKGNKFLIDQIRKITGQDEGKILASLNKLNVNLTRQNIRDPVFYEFDTILIDTKRVIEYYIKMLAIIMDQKEPKKISNFFKGLSKENPDCSNFCKILLDDYQDYCKFLNENWDKWIKFVNDYRYKSIHKSIKIEPKTTITSHYDKNKKPIKVETSEIKFNEIPIQEFTVGLWNNISNFLKNGYVFIGKNLDK